MQGAGFIPVGGAKCSGWGSHQVLQDSLSEVKLPGARGIHTLLIQQIQNGEVDGEWHQERGCRCRGHGRQTDAEPILAL